LVPKGTPMRYKDWKTVCLGRYLVDMPTEVTLNYGYLFSYNAGQYSLKKVQGTAEDAKKMAEAKANELKASPHDTKGSLYVRSIPLANGGILVQGYSVSFNVDSYDVFLYIPVVTRKKSFIYTYQGDSYPDSEQQDLKDFSAFAESFRPYDEGVIPKEPGLCLEDVILVNLPDAFKDNLWVNFNDPYATTLTLAFVAQIVFEDFQWLSKRPGWVDQECFLMGGSGKCEKLRFEKHPVGPIEGEELCLSKKTKDGRYRIYDFQWDNPGVVGSKTSPELTLSLIYPGPSIYNTTEPLPFFNDDEALAVWDRLVNSLRLRPTA